MLFVQTLERYFQFKAQDLARSAGKDPNNQALQDELKRWRDGRPSFKWNTNLFNQLSSYSLADELGRFNVAWLPQQDQKAVDAFRNQILTLWMHRKKGKLGQRSSGVL